MQPAENETHQDPNPGIIPPAAPGSNPKHLSELLASLDRIRQSGPLEAKEYPSAREALFHLWEAIQASPGASDEHVEAYRRAAQRVTLADYRDLLDDLLSELLEVTHA